MPYPSLVASGDLSSNQFRCVRLTASANFEVGAITNGNTQIPIGIQQNDPDVAGKGVEVAMPGEICKAELSGTVDEGNFLAPGNDGTLINSPQAEGSPDLYVIGMALQAGVSGDIVQILVTTPMKVSAE
jgi:hypothetical protein